MQPPKRNTVERLSRSALHSDKRGHGKSLQAFALQHCPKCNTVERLSPSALHNDTVTNVERGGLI
eukprot:5315298-Prorocentrum_lima.AAC.1